MYRIYYLDDKNRLRTFNTIAVSIDDAITRLFKCDPNESKTYKLIKLDPFIL